MEKFDFILVTLQIMWNFTKLKNCEKRNSSVADALLRINIHFKPSTQVYRSNFDKKSTVLKNRFEDELVFDRNVFVTLVVPVTRVRSSCVTLTQGRI